ncbi:MAG: gamma carbonic anhydrase family protein [Desulfomonile tiedjei]|uniref:Gamma carbonic anhydrase family protein n=1 Tax=Desulfomonile tiedjei TaxID=2358 RepID=A0A9D6V0W3_9BACT|nr:gamma carbonic anhydrase family protein [Desulfomonile tiedjei]
MIYEYKGIQPRLGKDVFLAPGAVVLGDVEIGDGSNIWFNTVIRGDVNRVRIGSKTNVQDLCMLHVTGGRFPLTLGDEVIVGHRVVLHGCTIHDRALIGIGALVLDGAVVEEGAIVAAGAVVTPGTVIPANRVAVGIPARPTREPTQEEKSFHQINLSRYLEYGRNFESITRAL